MRAVSRPWTCSLAGALAALLAGASMQAQAGPATDELDLLAQENQVYAASRYVQTIAETPADVAVISRDDIARFGYRSVQQALQSLPGLYNAASQWPALGLSGIAVPGDFGSRLLYLVNGMPVYEPTYGGFFLDYLDIESIERIEVVKGAGSALYGSGAVMGLVNLITRSGHDSLATSASATLASGRSGKAYWSQHRQDAQASSFISASAASSAGRDLYLPELDTPDFDAVRFHGMSRGNDGHHGARLFGRISTDQAWLQALLVAGSKRDPLASYGSVFNARLQLRETLAALEAGAQRALGEGGQLTLRAYLFSIAERGDYPYARSGLRGVPAQYINVSDLASRQLGAELRYDRFLASGHHVLAGLEIKRIGFSHVVGDQPGLLRSGVASVDANDSYTQWALFAQDELRLGEGKLFLGARVDSYQGFSNGVGTRVSPRIAYVQELGASTTAKLVYGEAYRAPTIYESRYQDGLPAASTIWANRDLRPEVSRSLEALLLGRAGGGLQWRLSAFLKQLRDTPVQVLVPRYQGIDCGLGADGCIQYRNAAQVQRVAGVEADVHLRQADRGLLYASLVLQHGHDQDGDLASSPRRLFKAGISRDLPWPNTDAALEAQYTGSMLGLFDGGMRDRVPASLVANLVINLSNLGDGWRAALRIDNLADHANATVASRELQPLRRVPAEGRRFTLHLQRDF
jgi:outer membrane cobalamin receptor